MSKEETEKKDAGSPAAGSKETETKAGIETVEALEAAYPKLITEVRDDVVVSLGKCSAKKIEENMPELFERIVVHVQGKGSGNLNVAGFLLEADDPFAMATLRMYGQMKAIDGLQLPWVLPYKVKGSGVVNRPALKKKFEASESLKAQYKDFEAYAAFKSKIIVMVLENYILRAEGGGDAKRAEAARQAMKKIK